MPVFGDNQWYFVGLGTIVEKASQSIRKWIKNVADSGTITLFLWDAVRKFRAITNCKGIIIVDPKPIGGTLKRKSSTNLLDTFKPKISY